MNFKAFVKKNKLIIIGAVIGITGGFLYWKFIGCKTGTCPIKSSWYGSTIYGGLLGALAVSIITDIITGIKKKKSGRKDLQQE